MSTLSKGDILYLMAVAVLFFILPLMLVVKAAQASPPPPPPHPCWVPPQEQLEIKGQRPDSQAHVRRNDTV